MKPKVLVTGATGFLGTHACRALARSGFEIHAVARQGPPAFPDDMVFHSLDLLAGEDPRHLLETVRPSHLLHLAWNAQPGRFWSAPDNLDWVGASLRLYRAFAAAGGRRAVFAGSCAEYDWACSPFSEYSTPRDPSTLYGSCKDAVRRVIEKAAVQDGVSFAWGRIFWLYGPLEPRGRLVSDLFSGLIEGREVMCTDGFQLRDFLHVEDAAQAFACLIASEAQGPINIGSGSPVSVREVASQIAQIIGRHDLVRFGALPTVPGEPAELISDISILKGTLGFMPRYTLVDGLENTAAWWRELLAQ